METRWFRVDDRGVVRVTDAAVPITRIMVMMHGPDWSCATPESPGAGVERSSEGVWRGHIPTPKNCAGALDYTLSLRPAPDGAAELRVRARFTERTDIYGAYLSVFLDADRVAGRPAALLPGGAAHRLPAGREPCRLSGSASAVVLDRPDGRRLVLATDAAAPVLVQNNRVFGRPEYEVRFFLFSRGPVVPGVTVERRLRVARVPAARAGKIVDALYPPRSLDRSRPFALVRAAGDVVIRRRDAALMEVRLALHGLHWSYADQRGAGSVNSAGGRDVRHFFGSMPVPGDEGRSLEFRETAAGGDGRLRLAYRLDFPRGARLNGYQVAFSASLPRYAGREIVLDAPDEKRTVRIGERADRPFLFEGEARAVTLAPGTPDEIVIAVEGPMSLLVQDNRKWNGDTVEFRFCFEREGNGATVPPGTRVERAFVVSTAEPLQVVLDEGAFPSRTDTRGWIPFVMPCDAAPVDVSFLNHKPAGKFGFVTVRDGRFVLAKTGREIRFWGTCLSAGANFPSHEQAEKIARRLAAFGVNIVRTHHADAVWAERNFFGKKRKDTRGFDPENLDRFDYFVACLKREGIYVYLDQLVHRRFTRADGVDAADKLPPAAKPYSNFDPKLIALQKEFSRALWTHVNPYTGLAYKDDPAVALMEFANENDLFTQPVTLEPYRARLEARFRKWAAANGVTPGPKPIDFAKRAPDILRFFVDVHRGFYREMERFLRDEVGVRVPMTGSNWSRNAALLLALSDVDYTDSHAYWNHPAKNGHFANKPMAGAAATILDRLAFQRLDGKPFFVSEWNEPWPNEWRAELPLWMAATASFQEWNGLTIYTYRHTVRLPVNSLSGTFETFNDPALFGLFPAAALAFRRGDFAPSRDILRIAIPERAAVSAPSPSPWSASAYQGATDLHEIRTLIASGKSRDGTLPYDTPSPAAGRTERRADTGEIGRDLKRRTLRLDSPRTQSVIGFLGDAGPLATRDVRFDVRTRFATVAVSSLTDRAIPVSPRLLVTAVGRAENTGFAYNMLRNRMLNSGAGPILVEPVRAVIELKTTMRRPAVIPIRADGRPGTPVPAVLKDGRLHFTIGPEARTIYYRIEERAEK